ncbi:LPXTG-motif cell wall anchor domain-containing protein [Paractinoplanes atraurantiacus]|uniref:LPXTG-motif cell wall anchor domain-containing protein n=1 Tax=Paractinoplanes atraurantiacus TaxID=1036182 RepID=A0A285FI71_9ACTN|nr:LPXTG-motif cell wall anchor domain-containing protein [Actinoplanes atraurantiacus]
MAPECHPGDVLEALTGTGLAASAGLNAYIPLVTMGLLARYTDLIDLPNGWGWLANGWTLLILALLLAIEVVADKVPVVDHVNDVVQTVVRPTAGGLAFGAGSASETVTVSDPGSFFGSHQWVPIAAGVVIALGVHGVKAASRPVVNTTTAGFGAPVASTAEDIGSVLMAVLAIVLPILVLVGLLLIVIGGFWVVRRRRQKRAKRTQLSGSGAPHSFG